MKLELPDVRAVAVFQFGLTPRLSDIDSFGVVHHTILLRYLEEARLELLRTRSFALSTLTDGGISVAVVELIARYATPAVLGDSLRIDVGISGVRTRFVDLFYRMSNADAAVVLTAATRLVCVDSNAGTVTRIPEDLRDALVQR